MTRICGWYARRPVDDGEARLRRMLAADPSAGAGASLRAGPHAGLALGGAGEGVLEHEGFVLVLRGHPRLRSAKAGSGDAALAVLHALRERGAAALPDIGGDFALAAWDERSGRGLVAVDRIGVHQIVHATTPEGLAFASTADALFGHPDVPRRLSRQGLFDYLYYHVSPGPATVFESVSRLPPGHCIEFGADAVGAPRAYWRMQFDEQPGRSLASLKEEFIGLLEQAVKECGEGPHSGSFLSGGTDSSTVSGMLGRVGGAPAQTFSIGFDAAGYDEMEYARIAARHFGCEHHEYYVTPRDVVDALPKIAALYDQPFGNASAVPTYYCARFAHEHGIRRLLAGDGGDELFGGNERYAKHHLLAHYQRVPSRLRSGVVEPLLLGADLSARLPLLRKLRSYVEQARPPMPRRYESYNLLERLGPQHVFTGEFLAAIDTAHPHRLMDEVHAPFAGASLIDQMLGIDLRFILADGDLPKVTRMCELAGVDVAFPLLDDRLIEFSRHLPAPLKLRGTKLRWFFKKALEDFLPPQIISKPKHGFGLPVGTWLIEHQPLQDLAVASIESLRPHGIVRAEFVDELLRVRLREHPAYYGTMVWVLMMLGLWLQSRRP